MQDHLTISGGVFHPWPAGIEHMQVIRRWVIGLQILVTPLDAANIYPLCIATFSRGIDCQQSMARKMSTLLLPSSHIRCCQTGRAIPPPRQKLRDFCLVCSAIPPRFCMLEMQSATVSGTYLIFYIFQYCQGSFDGFKCLDHLLLTWEESVAHPSRYSWA